MQQEHVGRYSSKTLLTKGVITQQRRHACYRVNFYEQSLKTYSLYG